MTDTYPRAKFDGDVIESVDINAEPRMLIDLVIRKLSGGNYMSSFEAQMVEDLEQALVLMRFEELKLTTKQKQAVLRVFHRGPITQGAPGDYHKHPLTLREFVNTIVPGHDCIMVPWSGMWLGIEKDGYTHS
jgi:hypothetical protein